MNNQQLIKMFAQYPNHPIHNIPEGATSARWLTFTAEPARPRGLTMAQIRKVILDALYEDWKDFQKHTIELPN